MVKYKSNTETTCRAQLLLVSPHSLYLGRHAHRSCSVTRLFVPELGDKRKMVWGYRKEEGANTKQLVRSVTQHSLADILLGFYSESCFANRCHHHSDPGTKLFLAQVF